MSYFISPPDETSWEFDLELFQEQLSQWSDIAIEEVDDPEAYHSLQWNLPARMGDLFGSLDASGQVIHLDGFLGDCALFALWLRNIVPPNIELLFYDEDYSADVALVTFTSESDLIRAFGS